MGRILRRRGLERGPAFVDVLLAFYTKRMTKEGNAAGQSGAVVVVQRTSSDLKLNPHLHVVFLDGVYRAQREHVLFHELPHLRSRDVAEVLTRATVRMAKYLRRRGARCPSFRRGALPRTGAPLALDKPLCVALDGLYPDALRDTYAFCVGERPDSCRRQRPRGRKTRFGSAAQFEGPYWLSQHRAPLVASMRP